jgi:hypothetical protein
MIVLNGEPFVRHNLRALYPFAHQIVVVEGACPSARGVATADGHSRDGTLSELRRFQAEEDPEGKLLVVTAEDEGHADGFWTEKDEMSQAYAIRATGRYLWQIDCDEFYHPSAMQRVVDLLRADPSITAMTFRTLTFWGHLDYRVDSHTLRTGYENFHRLFAWGPGYRYASHRPPTVLDAAGVDVRTQHWLGPDALAKQGIVMYHYALLLPKQVEEKRLYYTELVRGKLSRMHVVEAWATNSFHTLRAPFQVYYHKTLSWLFRHDARRHPHPPEVLAMLDAVRAGAYADTTLRRTDDIDALLASPRYRALRALCLAALPFVVMPHKARLGVRVFLMRTPLGARIHGRRGTS